MSDHDRVCQRAGCQRPAAVTLSFHYDARQASLVDLTDEKDPAEYDLCGPHADLLIVPRGWERLDRRTPRPDPDTEPELEVETVPSIGADRRMNRYAALTAELPRLAEAFGLTEPDDGAAHLRRPRATHHPAGPGAHGDAPRVAVDERFDAGHLFEPVTRTLLHDDVLEGQLQMPIEPEPQGVVVALTRTRNM